MPAAQESALALGRLLEVMRRLRDPIDGCPWDLVQTHATIAPYTIEEAFEAEDAIARNDLADLRDELGDLLLQVAFQAQIAHEAGGFDFAAVADAIAAKMIRRHPHIFTPGGDPNEGPRAWEEIKAAERRAKSATEADDAPESALDGVAATLPPMTRALKLQKRAARIGFDFPDWQGALAKAQEELDETAEAALIDAARRKDEVGDLLFAAVNLARKLDVDPDQALKAANAKFSARFRRMEALLRAADIDPAATSLERQDAAWDAAKLEERAAANKTSRT